MVYLERDRPRSQARSYDWRDVDWKISPERLAPDRYAGLDEKPTRWSRIARAAGSTLAALVLSTGLYFAHPEQPDRVENPPARSLVAQDGASLWSIAQDHLADTLPYSQPERDRALIDATDELARENGLCAPSVWHEEHPDAGYADALACADGSPSPHILEHGQRVFVSSLDGLVEGDESVSSSRSPDPRSQPDRSGELPSEDSQHSSPWARIAGAGAAALAGMAGLAAYLRNDRTREPSDTEFLDPPRDSQGVSIAYGHAYLASRGYLDRTSRRPRSSRLSGASRSAMERRASRLNRLAAALDASYDTRPLEETVREAIGDSVTSATARSYVENLAELGHQNAAAYLEHLPKTVKRRLRSKKGKRMRKVRKKR